MPALHDGRKEAWEELRWDQDIQRWVGARRDEPPANRMRPGHDDRNDHPGPPGPGLLD